MSERESLRISRTFLSKYDLSLPLGQCLLSQGGLEPLGAFGNPPAPVTPLQPHGGGLLASVPHVGVAAGFCYGDGSHLMKTLQDGQGIKQSRTMMCGQVQRKKKDLNMQS